MRRDVRAMLHDPRACSVGIRERYQREVDEPLIGGTACLGVNLDSHIAANPGSALVEHLVKNFLEALSTGFWKDREDRPANELAAPYNVVKRLIDEFEDVIRAAEHREERRCHPKPLAE